MSKNKPKNKIAIIIPYFGKWPAWFEYFLYSCSYNTFINWFFFTDCGKPLVSYKNISFIDFTLDDFNKLASQRIGITVKIKNPYKLCDLKPAYGDIFADYIQGFDFWGYGDIDLIYGNLNAYYIDELLENYDILSNNDQFICGHLCILRNSPQIVYLYRKEGLYKKVFADPLVTAFDEQLLKQKINPEGLFLKSRMKTHLKHHIFKVFLFSFLSGIIPNRLKSILRKNKSDGVKDFTSIVQQYAKREGIRFLLIRTFQSDLMLRKKGVKNWNIIWDKGHLKSSHNHESILYFHFILSKLYKSFIIQDFIPGTDCFTITKSGIVRGFE